MINLIKTPAEMNHKKIFTASKINMVCYTATYTSNRHKNLLISMLHQAIINLPGNLLQVKKSDGCGE